MPKHQPGFIPLTSPESRVLEIYNIDKYNLYICTLIKWSQWRHFSCQQQTISFQAWGTSKAPSKCIQSKSSFSTQDISCVCKVLPFAQYKDIFYILKKFDLSFQNFDFARNNTISLKLNQFTKHLGHKTSQFKKKKWTPIFIKNSQVISLF